MSEDKLRGKPVKDESHKRKKKVPKKITEKYLYNAGLAYLQRFPASSAHFKTVMRRKIMRSCRAHPDQTEDTCLALLDKVTEQFRQSGHLNDEAYLSGMVYSYRNRGLSAAMITLKLRQKGLEEDQIKQALTRQDDGRDDADIIAALRLARRKRIGPFAADRGDESLQQKWVGTLARAGFGFDTVRKILSMDDEEAARILTNLR